MFLYALAHPPHVKPIANFSLGAFGDIGRKGSNSSNNALS